MATSPQKTVALGAEHDGALRAALRDVLTRLGAKVLAHRWGVAGSQELETLEVLVGVDRVVIEAETFIGLTICGPADVIDRIRGMVAAAVSGCDLPEELPPSPRDAP